jgi:hypothetical protein
MILLVVAEWVLTIIQKKDYYNSLDTISATFIGLVNVGISALLKIGFFGLFRGASQANGGHTFFALLQ